MLWAKRPLEQKYLLWRIEQVGLKRTTFESALIAFVVGAAIIIPVNMLMGGSIPTGLTINAIICFAIFPYHLTEIGNLLLELEQTKRSLYAQSILDELTQSFNRRYFMENLHRASQRSLQSGEHVAVLFIDFDDFKTINDTYGHQAGDVTLKTVADCCKQTLRITDVFARYGGDEFVCFLPNTTKSQALEISERLLNKILGLPIHAAGTDFYASVSIGVASFQNTEKLDHLVTSADAALYKAKRSGKGRVFLLE